MQHSFKLQSSICAAITARSLSRPATSRKRRADACFQFPASSTVDARIATILIGPTGENQIKSTSVSAVRSVTAVGGGQRTHRRWPEREQDATGGTCLDAKRLIRRVAAPPADDEEIPDAQRSEVAGGPCAERRHVNGSRGLVQDRTALNDNAEPESSVRGRAL